MTEFKDASLEYICLNLEDMISNRYYSRHFSHSLANSVRLLQDLDDDLLPELDAVCRENQLTYLPISRGRNTEEYLFEKYPELVSLIEEDKQRKIDSMKIRSRLGMVESRPMASDKTPISPSPKPKAAPAEAPSSPILQSKQSTSDLMFQMDDDVPLSPAGALKGKIPIRGLTPNDAGASRSDPDFPALGSSAIDPGSFRDRSSLEGRIEPAQDALLSESPSESRMRKASGALSPPDALFPAPWGSPATPGSKKDLKEIMAETSETQHPNRPSLASGARESSGTFTSKLSQKERKKLQQQQAQEMLAVRQKDKETPQNPWKAAAPSKTPAKPESPALGDGVESKNPQKPSMTLRQTVAGTPPPPRPNPGPTPAQTQRASSTQTPTKTAPGPPSKIPSPSANTPAPHQQQQQQLQPQPSIHSIRHIPRPEPPSSPPFGSNSQSKSLASIFMQQQTEKNEIREAATAKHNLHDIQQEQEFQEWWDKESKRVQGVVDPEPEEVEQGGVGRDGKGKTGRGGRGGKGPSSSSGSSGPRKRRGQGQGQGQGPGQDVSALTQQLSGPGSAQQKGRRESGSVRGGHGHAHAESGATPAGDNPVNRRGGSGRNPPSNANANANANARRGKGRDQRGRKP